MLAMGVLFGIIAIIGFMWLYYSRSFKQAEVLLFQKGSLLTNQSRYLVCPKCGSAQAEVEDIKSVAKLDYERKEASHYFVRLPSLQLHGAPNCPSISFNNRRDVL